MKNATEKPRVATYLVEAYLARARDSELTKQACAAQAAAAQLTREGSSVRYLRMIFLPEEETCFHLYEAVSVADVREAAARAGIGCERVADAVDVAPLTSIRPHRRGARARPGVDRLAASSSGANRDDNTTTGD
jgi:uncharacterized protein DUF4242